MMESIAAALSAIEDVVVEQAGAALRRRGDPHYRDLDTGPKLHDLFRMVIASVGAGDPSLVADYGARVAAERLRSGFDLAEIQAAFNALEEAMWANAVVALAAEQRIPAVESVTRALGAGRDALARTYVATAAATATATATAGDEGPSPVTTDVRGQVGLLTLNDSPKRNALSARMVSHIIEALESFRAQQLRAVVIRSAPGMAVWSSGHDIAELPRGRRDPLAYNDPLEQCVRAVRAYPLPIVAMIHGSVWGGAFDLVLSCDVVVADETATFAITPANLGLPYNTTGLLHFLGRLPTNIIKEMFFTANPIAADQAERWMVVNHLVPEAHLDTFALDLATTMATKAPLAVAAVKEQLRVLSDYQPIAAQVYERIQSLRREAYDSHDYLEGITAFNERRRPHFRGD